VRVKGFLEILNPTAADDLVRVVQNDYGGTVILGTFIGKKAEGHDRDTVAFFAEVGDGSVEDDGTAAARGGDGVGLEAVAVRLVAYENFLEGRNTRGFEEFLVDRHAALVVHIRVGDDRTVDFGAEKMFEHWWNLVAGGSENQYSRLSNLPHFVHRAEELIEKDINHMPLADLDIHPDRHA